MKIYRNKDGKCNVSGSVIRKYREEKGLSQERLAAYLQLKGLDLNQKAISRIETGDRLVPDYELRYFSETLEVPITVLLQIHVFPDNPDIQEKENPEAE